MVHGKNFPAELVESEGKAGFYTCLILHAENVEAAEERGMELLRASGKLDLPEGVQPNEEARVFFEEIYQIQEEPEQVMGFIWYTGDDEEGQDVS